jgi:hypothetical protein
MGLELFKPGMKDAEKVGIPFRITKSKPVLATNIFEAQ